MGRGFWSWPSAGGYARTKYPRQVGSRGEVDARYGDLRRPGADMTGRPMAYLPAAIKPSGLYRPRGGSGLLDRYAGVPSGMVRPYNIRVTRLYYRSLIQHPYRSRYQPIMSNCPRPEPQFWAKTSRALPVRPALAYPGKNYRGVTEEEMIKRARDRAGLRAPRKSR